MANRVLLGKSSGAYNGTTIRTRASNGLGLWLSQSGSDVLTCPDSELIFASDASGSVGGSIAGNVFEVVGYIQMGPYASAALNQYYFTFPSLHNAYSLTSAGTNTYKQTLNGYSRALPPLILLFYQESIYEKPYLGHYQQFDWERVNTAGLWTTADVVGGERGGGIFGNIAVTGGGYNVNQTAYSGSGREYGLFRHGLGARTNLIITAVVTNLPLRG
mgnify:CR=1 FL=1|tara:strand:+ start:484 stop:1134 length:651 start_codon:yes stop_codon:yes gene_type:complete